MKKIAVIDLGTNGFRLQIAEVPHSEDLHDALLAYDVIQITHNFN